MKEAIRSLAVACPECCGAKCGWLLALLELPAAVLKLGGAADEAVCAELPPAPPPAPYFIWAVLGHLLGAPAPAPVPVPPPIVPAAASTPATPEPTPTPPLPPLPPALALALATLAPVLIAAAPEPTPEPTPEPEPTPAPAMPALPPAPAGLVPLPITAAALALAPAIPELMATPGMPGDAAFPVAAAPAPADVALALVVLGVLAPLPRSYAIRTEGRACSPF